MIFRLIYYSDLTSTREAIDLAMSSVDLEDLEDLIHPYTLGDLNLSSLPDPVITSP